MKDLYAFGVSLLVGTTLMLGASIFLAKHDRAMKQGIKCLTVRSMCK